MMEMGEWLIDAARAAEPALLCEAHIRRNVGTVTIANTNGGQFTYRGTTYIAGMYGTLIRGTDMLFVGDGDASCRTDIAWQQIKDTVRRQLEHSRRNASTRTAEMPVVFSSHGVADALAGPLTMAFSGRLLHQGPSPPAGCLAKEMDDK